MENRLIYTTFNKWTENLGLTESMINIFENVRNNPYMVIPELNNPKSGPVGLLRRGKGSCSPKHFLIAIMFKKLGIPVKYVTCPFSWDDPAIDYPLKLRKLAVKVPICYHLACKACIRGRWVLVDATWDPPLKKVGFPVNEKWDGISDTICAVKPLAETVHDTVESWTVWFSEREILLRNRFHSELNKWLEEVRR